MLDMVEYKITCTDAAITHAKKQIIKRNNPSTQGFRLGLKGGKCNGYYIIIEFVDAINTNDCRFEFDGFSIFIDNKSILYLNGMELDFVTSIMGYGFKFNVPKAKGSCSCGESLNF